MFPWRRGQVPDLRVDCRVSSELSWVSRLSGHLLCVCDSPAGFSGYVVNCVFSSADVCHGEVSLWATSILLVSALWLLVAGSLWGVWQSSGFFSAVSWSWGCSGAWFLPVLPNHLKVNQKLPLCGILWLSWGIFFESPESWPLCEQSLASFSAAKSLQLCPTLCDPIDVSPPDVSSPAPEILQARTLEWAAISFSRPM